MGKKGSETQNPLVLGRLKSCGGMFAVVMVLANPAGADLQQFVFSIGLKVLANVWHLGKLFLAFYIK